MTDAQLARAAAEFRLAAEAYREVSIQMAVTSHAIGAGPLLEATERRYEAAQAVYERTSLALDTAIESAAFARGKSAR